VSQPVRTIVIVGGVAGGASCAARLRRLDEAARIVVFERGPHVSFANCGLPYFLGGEITEKNKLLVQTPQRLKAVFNLDVRVLTEVIAIDRAAKEVEVRDVSTGQVSREPYDALVLSPGAAPLVPAIPGIARPGHFTLRNIPDLEGIDDWIKANEAKKAVVVGGGYIGLEVAEQLKRRGLDVALVEAAPQVLAPFDPEMAAHLHQELRAGGVTLSLGQGVVAFEEPTATEPAKASVVVLADGTRWPADVVVLGLGVRPEAKLARDAGLVLGERGGIRVDESLRTSDPAIYAVGDAVEVQDFVTKQWALIALAGPANRMGRIAADNIAGRRSTYPGTLGTAIVRVFRQTAACTGANEKTLRKLGRPFKAIHLHPNSHAGYYPGAKPIAMKLLFDPADGAILGAQAVGEDGVDKRIDVIATAIKGGMTVDDLAEMELCYAPPFGSAKDPVNLAGMIAQNVIAGDVEVAQWSDVATLDPNVTAVLDVRDSKERDAGSIPQSLHIPLPELRSRYAELPKDRELLVHCASGLRSYTACRLLTQLGFRCRNLTGSYKTWAMAQAHSQ
jgi:NADPH-dependent 2,4-dienoyl-CoA reductase/sulfur reductase-like enzyme/rhodanese-related sulfurtransferase